jgi:hypothetical protein
MKDELVTFAVLDRFLNGIGFERLSIPKGYAFSHKPSGCVIFLRRYKENEEVSPTDLTVVRRYLDEFGLMERSDFDRRVRTHSHAV